MCYIMVVEDEALLAFMMEADLKAVTSLPVEICNSPDGSFALVANGAPALAFLDINLGGETSFAIAEWLLERQVPTYFVTSYSRASLKRIGIPESLSSVGVIAKVDFRKAIRALLADIEGGCKRRKQATGQCP